MRVFSHRLKNMEELWNASPRKASLARVLHALMQWIVSLPMAEDWNLLMFKVPSMPKHVWGTSRKYLKSLQQMHGNRSLLRFHVNLYFGRQKILNLSGC